MDVKDEKILSILKENSRLSTQQISKKTLIPITTVYNRIRKLEKEKVIKKYTVLLDNKKVGKPVSAYILVIVDYRFGKQSQIDMAKKIYTRDVVEEVSIVTGSNDMVIKVRVKDMDQLNNFVVEYLRMLDGVERTQTLVVLNEV